MSTIGNAAAILAVWAGCLASPAGLAETQPSSRYHTPAAYPEPDSAAVWRSLGASYVRKAVKENQIVRDPVLNARVDAAMAAVGKAASALYPRHAGTAWRALLIDDFGHGAVAFPGGTVLVDATFVRQLEMTDDELALLLAHEVAHVVADHPSEKLSFVAERLGKDKAPTAWSALLAFFSVDTYALMFQPVARLQEREADVVGAVVLDASGYDARRALELFDKLARLEHHANLPESATHDTAGIRRQTVLQVLEGLRRGRQRPAH
jgi:predicted Zn-dependent protease